MQTDALQPGRDRGLSEFDVQHRFTLYGLLDLPSPKIGGLAKTVLGGWQHNWIASFQSGRPFGVYCSLAWFNGCEFNMDADQNDRPNRPANLATSEMFNIFNHTNLYQPTGNMGSPNFGKSTAAFAARQIQFGLKFLF